MNIHPTAIIDPQARLGEDVTVGPYAIINKEAVIGAGTEIMAHAYIDSYTTVGSGCRIFPFATLGTTPQDISFAGEKTGLVIGNNVTIREYANVSRGTARSGQTSIGDGSYLMAYAHVGHDCRVGRNVILVNNLAMGGHVVVGDEANVSGVVAIHQYVRIGTYAFIGAFSYLTKDAPPYMITQGTETLRTYGPNVIGLTRKGFSRDTISALKDAYRIIFRSKMLMKDGLEKALAGFPEVPEVKILVEFIKSSERGVVK